MLHAKFQDHQASGSREKKTFKAFTIIWACWRFWSCDQDHLYKLSFTFPMETQNILDLIGQELSERKMFENYVYIHVPKGRCGKPHGVKKFFNLVICYNLFPF